MSFLVNTAQPRYYHEHYEELCGWSQVFGLLGCCAVGFVIYYHGAAVVPFCAPLTSGSPMAKR